jgi:hypothetical protein
MKRSLFLICFFPLALFAQNSYTVCNVPGVKADYYTLQGAIDSVAAGSILYLLPSPNDYGSGILNKKLIIFGTGYMLDQNSEPATSPNINGVVLDALVFKTGSSGSYVDGLQIMVDIGPLTYRVLLDSVSNITINHCLIRLHSDFTTTLIYGRNSYNCFLEHCFFVLVGNNVNHSAGQFYREIGTGSQNIQFNNNIVDCRNSSIGLAVNGYGVSSAFWGSLYFAHNTFYMNLGASFFGNATYHDNFFMNSLPSFAINLSGMAFNGPAFNNITDAPALFPSSNGNFPNANGDSIFVYSTFGYHSWDEKWKVRDTSFAKTYASDGGEVGAYGGTNSYKLSGLSPLPYIYNLTITRDPAIRGNVKVHIKAKASQ